jgi:hypothetical protein
MSAAADKLATDGDGPADGVAEVAAMSGDAASLVTESLAAMSRGEAAATSVPASSDEEETLVTTGLTGSSDDEDDSDAAAILARTGDVSGGKTIVIDSRDNGHGNEDPLFSQSSHTDYGIALQSEKTAMKANVDPAEESGREGDNMADADGPAETVPATSDDRDLASLPPLTSELSL